MTREASRAGSARRLRREERTIAVMVGMYCRDHHGASATGPATGDTLCADCAELLAYARRRLDVCRFGADKPTCAKCPIHCYAPTMRERAREVMRYSGPRMLGRHPVLGIAHLVDGRRAPDGRGATSRRNGADDDESP